MTKKGALVLAAGKGTRMPSPRPKVLNTILDIPMVTHVCRALKPMFGSNIFVLVGHMANMIRKELADEDVHFVFQKEQLGTAHALKTAMPELLAAGCSEVLVINGDTPLISRELIESFLIEAGEPDLAFASIKLPDPGAYGRVVRHNGQVAAIVEAKDYDTALYGPVSGEVNAGLYHISLPLAQELLPRIDCANKNGEYYITDLVRLAVESKFNVAGILTTNESALLGVNTPVELALCENIMRFSIVQDLLKSGVIIHAPDLVRVSPTALVEPGATLNGPCEIYGSSIIKSGAYVDSHCVLRNAQLAENAHVHSFCHIENAQIGPNASVGPFARLRPGAVLEEESKAGNFVEIKKSRLGKKAKVSHLTYIGDADIGAGANIGAGTITCNYDGKNKFKTIIAEDAFIGSNSALVAPVSIGRGALVGAGSVITKDVPDEHLGIARGRQSNIPLRKKND